jgi:cytochrome P450
MPDPREGEEFFLTVPQRLDDPFPDLQYFRAHRPVFYDPPLQTWFIFRYDDVTMLFQEARLSADRMKGFVDAAPAEVRDELRPLAPSFESWVMIKDGPDHTRYATFSTAMPAIAGLSPYHWYFRGVSYRGMREGIWLSHS